MPLLRPHCSLPLLETTQHISRTTRPLLCLTLCPFFQTPPQPANSFTSTSAAVLTHRLGLPRPPYLESPPLFPPSTNESPQHVIKGMFFINSRRLTHDTVLLELKCLWAGVSVLSVAVCRASRPVPGTESELGKHLLNE